MVLPHPLQYILQLYGVLFRDTSRLVASALPLLDALTTEIDRIVTCLPLKHCTIKGS